MECLEEPMSSECHYKVSLNRSNARKLQYGKQSKYTPYVTKLSEIRDYEFRGSMPCLSLGLVSASAAVSIAILISRDVPL